jgi:hypothetical protein
MFSDIVVLLGIFTFSFAMGYVVRDWKSRRRRQRAMVSARLVLLLKQPALRLLFDPLQSLFMGQKLRYARATGFGCAAGS